MNPIDPATTAFMIMDIQDGILSRMPDTEALLDRIESTLDTARAAGVHIGYVRVAFTDEDFASIPAHSSFAAIASDEAMRTGMHADAPTTAINARVAPAAGDIVVRKQRVGPFTTTDLQAQLDARGITTLVLSGLSTSGVVLSTVRQAADLDYRVVVVEDLVGDPNAEAHAVLTQQIFPRQGEVVSSSEFAAALG